MDYQVVKLAPIDVLEELLDQSFAITKLSSVSK
jgi:hypothetical protein